MTGDRIAALGAKANALRRAGFYTAEEVRWIAEQARAGSSLLIEIEVLVENAAQEMRRKGVDIGLA